MTIHMSHIPIATSHLAMTIHMNHIHTTLSHIVMTNGQIMIKMLFNNTVIHMVIGL